MGGERVCFMLLAMIQERGDRDGDDDDDVGKKGNIAGEKSLNSWTSVVRVKR